MNLFTIHSVLSLFGVLVLIIQGNGVNGDVENQYLGCYYDKVHRDMMAGYVLYFRVTPQRCINYCKSQFKFAATQNGRYCYCGDSFGKYGQAPKSECNSKCSGNSGVMCGGNMRNSIYSTKTLQSKYLGCYIDKSRRDITGGVYQGSLNSVSFCLSYCRRAGYKYAGLQGHSWCNCGDTYGKYGKAAPSQCNQRCSANRNEICGGNMRNSVYATGL